MTHPMIELPGYRLLDQLHVGVKSLVYRAQRLAVGQTVIVKVLRSERPTQDELMQFRHQFAIARGLHRPNIVQPYDLLPYHQSYALILEDFGGISLSQWLEQRRTAGKVGLELLEFLEIAQQLTAILKHLNDQDIIHKDIKPSNLLINPATQQVKLTDFSLASRLPREALPRPGYTMLEGTLAYISPEQTGRINRGVDYRTDYYSLGVTLYELLTGQVPFAAETLMGLVYCHIAKTPPPIASLNPTVPAAVAAIVSKLMAKNPEDRYQSAVGLHHDFERCRTQLEYTGQIAAFELGQRDRSGRFLIPEKLYGREQAVAAVLAAFERVGGAGESGGGEIVLVAGDPGVGKTAVVNEVQKPMVRRQGYFIQGKFDQFKRNTPFSGFLTALQALMQQLLSEPEAQLRAWCSGILAALGTNGQLLIDVIPGLEQIIGPQPPVVELSGQAAQHRFNRLFQNFIQVFAAPQHPLVVFLDDLQWADLASLQLMTLLMGDLQSPHLLLVGAYRNNEVSPAHPLMLTLDSLRQSGATISTITLPPLSADSLSQLVADTLVCPVPLAQPLADLVYQKTEGNPFFATQFLQALHQEGTIAFDPVQGAWQCDLARARSAALGEDVVIFMAQQLQKLSPPTQAMLKLAACIGNPFSLGTLALVSEQPETDVAIALWSALELGLVLPQSELHTLFLEPEASGSSSLPALDTPDLSYRFLHDRIQQAAYSLIPADQRSQTHLTIGQLLWHKSSPAQRDEQLFTIVNHLNEGQALLPTAEREQLAQLNLQAGRKAKAATAYPAALDYLRQGIALLPANTWRQQYDLTLALHQEITEAAYLSTDFEQMEQWADLTLRHAYNLLDQLPVYEVRLLADRAQGNYLAAVHTGLDVLHTLGVDLPTQPAPTEVQQALAATRQLWAGQAPLSLLALPSMVDAQRLAAMQIMTKLSAPTYRALPALMPLLMAKQVEFSIRYGNSSISIFAYAGYGMALCSMGDIEAGYGFGQLALGLLEQLGATACESRAGYLVHNFISHWRDPIRQSLPAFGQAYQSGLATGDLECVVLNAQAYSHYAYFAGQPLADLAAEMAAYRQTLRQLKQVSLKCLEIVQQTVLNLLGEGENPWCLSGSVYEAESSVRFHLEHSDRTSLFHYHFNQMVLYYLFGQIELAAQQADQVAAYLDGGRAQFPSALYACYDALIQLALYDQTPAADQPARWQRIQQQQAKLAQWASFAPSNHRHRWQLVEAEIARVEGRYLEAMAAYDGAIASAKAQGFIQDEGLANELAARFYRAWGRDNLAQPYLQAAYHAYAHWGAKAKLHQLETLYPEALQGILSALPAPGVLSVNDQISSRTSDTAALDLAAVIQASQAISQELRPEQLIVTLMQLALENAGAERGALILRQADQLMVVAQCLSGETCQGDLVPLETSSHLPISLIHFVDRTATPLVIDDMRVELRFAADPYLGKHSLKSVLGLPLVHKSQAMGMLYLENNLTTGAFTCDRLQVLDILCAQAAISFENANLYQNLALSNQTLQQSLTSLQKTQAQLLQATEQLQHDALYDGLTNLPNRACFLNSLNHAIQMRTQHPEQLFAVLFMDLDRFKNINDSLGHLIGDEFLKLASQRLQRCVRPADIVARFGGDEFAILLEDLPHPDDALAIAKRIQDQFSLAFRVSDYEVFSTTSTGITYSTLNYQVATHVLRDADIALYQAKAKGRNQYVVFDPAMQTQITQRLQLEGDLRRAIEAEEFCLYYQPIVSLATGQARGFEALVRWQHPTRGLVSPLEFIPVAEETGLIGPIGWWVLEVACQQLSRWQAAAPQPMPLTINVNLSAIQLRQPELIDRLEAILEATQIPRQCLKLEITESCILETFTPEAQALKWLKAQGVRLCIDDFGTGYSSLSRLHEFPIDTLKIDRSFVQRLNPTAPDHQTSLDTVEMILTLAHSLNMDVVAEGIETAAELAILKDLGCEFGQGYWFAPPMATESATQWLHPG